MAEMWEGLEVRPVAPHGAAFAPLRKLMDEASPREELVPYPLLPLLCRRDVGFTGFYQDGELAGLVCLSPVEEAVYVLFLAVTAQGRSRGTGSAILRWVDRLAAGRPVFLEVEPPDGDAPNIDQRRARLRFYRKNGFVDTGYTVHEGRVSYNVLVKGPEGTPIDGYRRAVSRFYRYLSLPRLTRRYWRL